MRALRDAGRPSSALAVRLLTASVIAVGMLLALAGPASAHAALVSSSPGAGYAVVSSPAQLVLSFNEPVTLPGRALVVRGADEAVELAVTLDPVGTTLVAAPAEPLPEGSYEVVYRVVGRDGDLVSGSFTFGVATAVEAATGAVPGSGDPDRVQPVVTLLRGLVFLGLALGLGGGYLAWRIGAATGRLPGVRPLVGAGSLLALAGAAGLLASVGPASQLPERLTEPGVARLLAFEVALLALAASTARRPGGVMPWAFMLAVVVLEGVRAHPGEVRGAQGGALTVVHLLAGALWLGGLVHTLRLAAAWRGKPAAVRAAVTSYARNAFGLFVLVAASGTLSVLTLLRTRTDWTGTTYGRVLLVKLAAFGLVLLAALVAQQRRRGLGRAPAVEVALLTAVVFAAAAVTSVTPAALVPASSQLVAPVGPTLRTAERVAQVSISVVASDGRLEVRADAPDDGEPLTIAVTGRLRVDGGDERRLDLAPCGDACWTAPVDWTTGRNTLVFDVDVKRWRAGRVAIPVVWPIVPAPALLPRVQEAMGARSVIDTVEAVTSGFGVVVPHSSRRDGQEFLFGQPWAQGGATDAVVVDDGGQRTLLFALPSLGYHFRMVLDDADRIVSERIVTPNHLLTREYRYPD